LSLLIIILVWRLEQLEPHYYYISLEARATRASLLLLVSRLEQNKKNLHEAKIRSTGRQNLLKLQARLPELFSLV
jgi:hypothetical protein